METGTAFLKAACAVKTFVMITDLRVYGPMGEVSTRKRVFSKIIKLPN